MSHAPSFFPQFNRQIADTSRAAWERILPTLSERERVVFLALCDYCTETGYPDATGGELAQYFLMPVTSTRPRLHGLDRKGWVEKQPARASRANELHEGTAHPYKPAVPRSAVERIR